MNVAEASREYDIDAEEAKKRILAAAADSTPILTTTTTQPAADSMLPSQFQAPVSATTESLLASTAKMAQATETVTQEGRQSALIASLKAAAPVAAQDFERVSYAPVAPAQDFERASYAPVAPAQDFERASYTSAPFQMPESFQAPTESPGQYTRLQEETPLALPAGFAPAESPGQYTRLQEPAPRAELVKLPEGFTTSVTGGAPTPAQAPRAQSVEPGKIVTPALPPSRQQPGDVAPRAVAAGAVAQPVQRAGLATLADTRKPFVAELKDPEVNRLLMASTLAEVGSQGTEAQQAYMESVMNRAAAENRSLKSVLIDPKYYPEATKNKLGASISGYTARGFQPIINSVLGGSNITNFATGNESGNVHSEGAPVTFKSGGERFVQENWTQPWVQGMRGGSSAPAAGGGQEDLSSKVNALISKDNTIKMPKLSEVDTNDPFAVAQHQALQVALQMQKAGYPIDRDQLQKLVMTQYTSIQQQQVEQAKEQREHLWEIQKSQVIPKPLGAAESDQLSQANTSMDMVDNLERLYEVARQKGVAGSWGQAATGGLAPEAIQFDTARAAAVTPTAKGVLGNVGNLSEMEQKMPLGMLPERGDSPEVVKGKLANLRLQIANQTTSKIDSYKRSNIDVSGWGDVYKRMSDIRDQHLGKIAAAPGTDESSKTAAHDQKSSVLKMADLDKNQQSANQAPASTPAPTPAAPPVPTPPVAASTPQQIGPGLPSQFQPAPTAEDIIKGRGQVRSLAPVAQEAGAAVQDVLGFGQFLGEGAARLLPKASRRYSLEELRKKGKR